MLNIIFSGFVGLMALAMAGSANASVILITDINDQLIGANNVEVNGTFYNVTFQDGSCASVFSGCDNAGDDFDFTDSGGAQDASTALVLQVFNPSIFGSEPIRISGCDIAENCRVATPHALTLSINNDLLFNAKIANIFSGSSNTVGSLNSFPSSNFILSQGGFDPDATFARFTAVTVESSIPEPRTLALFAIGLAGLGFMKRREMKAA